MCNVHCSTLSFDCLNELRNLSLSFLPLLLVCSAQTIYNAHHKTIMHFDGYEPVCHLHEMLLLLTTLHVMMYSRL